MQVWEVGDVRIVRLCDQVIQDRKRRGVSLSLRVEDGEGVGTQWMAWKIQKTVETVVWG